MRPALKYILFILTALICNTVSANEYMAGVQNVYLKKQQQSGWQNDLMAKFNLNDHWDAGAEFTYLKRFSIYDKRYGAFVVYRNGNALSLEAHFNQGIGNKILSEKQETLTAYYALTKGISPFLTLRNSEFSSSKVQTVSLGTELELIPHWIFIPQFMIGRSKVEGASDLSLHNVGLKAQYYVEKNYSLSGFFYKGVEASESVTGAPNSRLKTTTFGVGSSYYLFSNVYADLIVEQDKYKELDNKFFVTTLNIHLLH